MYKIINARIIHVCSCRFLSLSLHKKREKFYEKRKKKIYGDRNAFHAHHWHLRTFIRTGHQDQNRWEWAFPQHAEFISLIYLERTHRKHLNKWGSFKILWKVIGWSFAFLTANWESWLKLKASCWCGDNDLMLSHSCCDIFVLMTLFRISLSVGHVAYSSPSAAARNVQGCVTKGMTASKCLSLLNLSRRRCLVHTTTDMTRQAHTKCSTENIVSYILRMKMPAH